MNTDKIIAESIAKEYVPKVNWRVVALKKLDKHVKRPATIFAYSFGIVSALVAVIGVCLSMCAIGCGTENAMSKIFIGIIGLIGCVINYPIFKSILVKRKAQYAFDIMQIASEIVDERWCM